MEKCGKILLYFLFRRYFMETTTIIILALITVISIILILSVVHISSKVDEISNYTKKLTEIMEKNNKEN